MTTWKEPKSDYLAGNQVTPLIFNELAENEKYLNSTKITTEDVQKATVFSSQNPSRVNLTEQDTVMGAFGKIRKWFDDLRSMGFKDSVADADIISVSIGKVTGSGALATKDTVSNNEITDVSGSKVTSAVPRATADGNGNNIISTYLTKSNPAMIGQLNIGDSNTKLQKSSVSPNGNNIGATGAMLAHVSGDEGGLLVTEDGTYLWNSTDSGSLLRGMDEDNWSANTGAKKDCTFANGLMFDFDSSGNLKIKGKFYQDSGTKSASSEGELLWQGNSSGSIPSTALKYADWSTRYSALILTISGSYNKSVIASLKGQTGNFYTSICFSSLKTDYEITIYSIDVYVPYTSGSFSISQRYINWQKNTSTWTLLTPTMGFDRIVGIM